MEKVDFGEAVERVVLGRFNMVLAHETRGELHTPVYHKNGNKYDIDLRCEGHPHIEVKGTMARGVHTVICSDGTHHQKYHDFQITRPTGELDWTICLRPGGALRAYDRDANSLFMIHAPAKQFTSTEHQIPVRLEAETFIYRSADVTRALLSWLKTEVFTVRFADNDDRKWKSIVRIPLSKLARYRLSWGQAAAHVLTHRPRAPTEPPSLFKAVAVPLHKHCPQFLNYMQHDPELGAREPLAVAVIKKAHKNYLNAASDPTDAVAEL